MKLVQTVYMTPVDGPSLTAVQKNAKYNSTVDIDLGSETHPILIPQTIS